MVSTFGLAVLVILAFSTFYAPTFQDGATTTVALVCILGCLAFVLGYFAKRKMHEGPLFQITEKTKPIGLTTSLAIEFSGLLFVLIAIAVVEQEPIAWTDMFVRYCAILLILGAPRLWLEKESAISYRNSQKQARFSNLRFKGLTSPRSPIIDPCSVRLRFTYCI